MTKNEFNEIDNYDDLVRTARDFDFFDSTFPNGCMTEDAYEDEVLENIKLADWLSDVRSMIEDLPSSNYDRYMFDSFEETWYGTDAGDSTFESCKNRLRDCIDEDDLWSVEPEPEEEPEEPPAEGESSEDILGMVTDIVSEYTEPEPAEVEEPEQEEVEEDTTETNPNMAEDLMRAFEKYCEEEVKIELEETKPKDVNLNELFMEA